jgi:hypothetical protein
VLDAVQGRPALRFAGHQEFRMTTASVDFAQATIFAVLKNNEATHRGQILSNCTSSGDSQFRFDGSATRLYFFGAQNGLDVGVSLAAATTDFQVISLTLSASELRVSQNGAQQAALPVATSGPWTFGQIGAHCNSDYLEGSIAEIMAYNRVLSDAERQQVHAYLQARYGL